MDTTLYKVVFDGKTQPDHPPEQVKKNFSHLFRAQTPQIERLFSGQPIIVRKNLNQNEARCYEEAITQAGAVCRILVQKPTARATPSSLLNKIREIPPQGITQTPEPIITLSPKGRLGRAYFITSTSSGFLLATLLSAAAWMLASSQDPVISQSVCSLLVISSLSLALLACIPLQIRRLHDIGYSGWFSLISLTPLTNIPFLLYIALQPGNRGKNHYGNPPKQPPSLINLLAIGLPMLLAVASELLIAASFSER